MFYNNKNDIHLDLVNNKKHCNEANAINDETPPTLNLKHSRHDNYHEEAMPFLGEYDPNTPYPIVSSMIHNNGSSFSGPGNKLFNGPNVRNLCQRDGRIVTTDVEDLSTDEDNTCPASNKGVADEMFDSISSNPASSIMHQESCHPSALLNSIPPPPSEPPPSTPRDSYQESMFPKGTMMISGSHGGLHGMRNMIDHDHILQQIPGVMEAEPIPISYLMTKTNTRMPNMYTTSSNGPNQMPGMGTIGRFRNQNSMSDNAAMATLPYTHTQNGFGTGIIPRGSGSVGGNSNVYENPYNSLNRPTGKQIKISSTSGFPGSNSTHEIGFPVLTKAGIAPNQFLYRQGSIRSPPPQSFSDPFFGIGKEGGGRCSWNCIRISLFSLAILLLLSLIAYFAAKSVWLEGRLNKRFAQDPVVIGLFDPNNVPELITPMRPITINLKAMGVWSGRWIQNRSDYIHFNFTINAATNLGVFLRINSIPTIVRYSFFDRISGYRWKQRILDPNRNRIKRSTDDLQESTGIVNYLEKGLWFVSLVNDQPREENIIFILNNKVAMKQSCPESCLKHGLCTENGHCECFTGFKGRDCSIVDAPEVCTGHGNYFQGRCRCNPEWKGLECQTIWYECEQSSCSGNGDCVSGDCICKPGYGGNNCSNVLCPRDCSQQGLCLKTGVCKCFHGWSGRDCSRNTTNGNYQSKAKKCENNAKTLENGTCKCTEDYEGVMCEKKRCVPACVHGRCTSSNTCQCDADYSGEVCDRRLCDARCYQHGRCFYGTCVCNKGWNGKYCSLDGCPNQCSNHGQCHINADLDYKCTCHPTWKGISCNISKEKDCDDGVDNDNDGLIDCQDPDCCPTERCELLTIQKEKLAEESCPLMDSLQLLLLTTKLARPGSAFHEQIEFLTKRKYTSSNLNENKISVVRGTVIQEDGSSFQGCRIQDRLRPANGHTFTDKQGIFDLVVEGGSLIQLEIIRHPGSRFTGYHNVYVPINEFVNIGEFELKDRLNRQNNNINNPVIDHGCVIGDKSIHDSSIVEGPKLLVDRSSEILPIYDTGTLSMAIDNGILINSIDLKETNLKLMHRSSRVKGFKSAIMILILGSRVPPELKEIQLHIDVAGQITSRRLEPEAYLTNRFYWDRQNAYHRIMYGLSQVKVSAGYLYWNCSRVHWEVKTTWINGHDLAAKDISNWNLNVRHIFDYNHGIVYRGDGSHIFFTETNWKISSIAGIANEQREIGTCTACDGNPAEKRFFALNSLISDHKGQIIIADGKYIRIMNKVAPNGNKWVMLAPYYLKLIKEVETYSKPIAIYLAKHENSASSSNDLTYYVSVPHSGSIWLINPAKETYQLIIGESCDNRACVKEKLVYPKGMAMSYNFSLYFADARSIKVFSKKDMTVSTIVGDASSLPEHSRLPNCFEGVPASKTRLKWPSHVLYNHIDDSIYFVDNLEMVYRISLNNLMVTIFAGNVLNCAVSSDNSETVPANRYKFNEIRDIALSPSGDLYVAEKENVFIVRSDGNLYAVAGTKHHSHYQNKRIFTSITAITVTMYGELIVADNSLFQLFSVHYVLPILKNGQYQVLSSDTREMYSFNTDGQHVNTDSSITGTKLYSLHFRLHTINGWLSKIVSPSTFFQFIVHRDTQSRPTQLETPSGVIYNVSLDDQKRIISLTMPTCTWRFEYNDQDHLISIQECQQIAPYRFSYYPDSGRLQSIIRPSGVTTTFEEHPIFYQNIQKRYKQYGSLKHVNDYRLTSLATTSYTSLFYSDTSGARAANNDSHIVIRHLKAIGPSTRIKLLNGFQSKEMSLIDSQFKIQYPTHSILFYHLKTFNGMRLTKKIYFKTTKAFKTFKSEWTYRIWQFPSKRLRRKRSNMRLIRNYIVSNDDYETNDASSTALFGHPRILKINGIKRIQIQYETTMKEEHYSLFDEENTKFLFRIQYNDDYQVTKISFSNSAMNLADVLVSYLSHGKISTIQWNKPILQIDYDRFNRTSTIFNAYLNEKLFYKYDKEGTSDKIIEVSRGKNYWYRFIYDSNDKLASIWTPNKFSVEISQLISLGYRRIMYKPYGVTSNFLYDFDTLNGNLFRLIYPSRDYQINMFYTTDNQLSDVIYGPERITWLYNGSNDMVYGITKWDHSRGFKLQQKLTFDGPFLSQINCTVSLPLPSRDLNVYNSRMTYKYSTDMQLSGVNLLLHDPGSSYRDHIIKTTFLYDSVCRLTEWDEFKFEIGSEEKITLPTDNSDIFVKYNSNGLLQSRRIRNNKDFLSLDVVYDENSKNPLLITSFKIRRSNNNNDEFSTKMSYYIDSEMITNVHNIDYIQYKYHEDGRLKSMRINSGPPVEYLYDETTGLLRKCGPVVYVYSDNGFLTQKLTAQVRERYMYNGFGLLKEYWKQLGKATVTKMEYFYDSKHRLIVQRDLVTPNVMYQFYYSDPRHPERLTNMYDDKTKHLSTYYYETVSGHLFAIRVDKTLFYVLSDYNGSPRVIISHNFVVVWERDYDIFGEYKVIKDWNIHIPIGFAGSICDPASKMTFMNNRMYDPNAKSYASFHWFGLFSHLSSTKLNPLAINSYQFHYFPFKFDRKVKIDFSNILRPDFWMNKIGINVNFLTSEESLELYKSILSLPKDFVIKYELNQFKMDSLHTSMAEHNAQDFKELRSLLTSDLVSHDLLPCSLTLHLPQIPTNLFSFHPNVSISISNGGSLKMVTKINHLDSPFKSIANALFRNTTLLNVYSSKNDKILIYLIKDNCKMLSSDLLDLGMSDRSYLAFGHNLNLSVTYNNRKSTEIVLLQRNFIISVRYCSSATDQLSHIIESLKTDTQKRFWVNKRLQLYSNNSIQDQLITDSRQELLKHGILAYTVFDTWHNISTFPLLVDDVSVYKIRKRSP